MLVYAAVAFVLVGTYTGSAWTGLVAAGMTYFVAVQLRPWTGCLWCRESPKRRDESGRNWRYCWVCAGSGRRLRVLALKRWIGR